MIRTSAALLTLAVFLVAAVPGRAQAADPAPSTEEAGRIAAAPGALPGAFVDEDKSPFLTGLRRFEIVAFGSFPIMLFYANLGFDLSRYARSGYDPYYAPWPFKSEYSYQPSNSEILASIGTAALLSVGVGAIDAIIRSVRAHRASPRPPRVDSP